jgi:hypothetical protein
MHSEIISYDTKKTKGIGIMKHSLKINIHVTEIVSHKSTTFST